MFITTERQNTFQKLLRDSKTAWWMKVLAAKLEDDDSDWEKGTETYTLSSDLAKPTRAHVNTCTPTPYTHKHTLKNKNKIGLWHQAVEWIS